jgi:putative thioredoxin
VHVERGHRQFVSSIAMTVIDVTEATFEQEVVERSRTTPVVVDFWAEWCGPCRTLTPMLEKATAAREGDVVLAKLDTDANQQLAAAFQIQGIPAVKAFKDGQVVDQFVGVQPPPAVEQFFDRLVPSEADRLVEAGDETSLRRAIELQPGRADASVALGELLYRRGEVYDALEILDAVPRSFAAEGLAARIRLERDDPDLAAAFKALDDGETEHGLDLLLEALPHADGRKDDIRRVVVGVLDRLGVEHPLARETRRRLASALY